MMSCHSAESKQVASHLSSLNMDHHDKRAEKSWNDPPMFSIDQMNKAAHSVPVNKRYRYPQQAAPAPTQNQMYQQNSYGYPGQQMQQQPANTFQPSFGQQQQQQQPQQQQSYPTSYSPYTDPNVAQQVSSNYSNPSPNQSQQYSQFPQNQPPMANSYASMPAYANNPNQPVNYGANQFSNNPASQYNPASQFSGQPPQMQPNFQSQQYNPQARY